MVPTRSRRGSAWGSSRWSATSRGPGTMVAEGDMVIHEHSEEWHWGTGELVVLPFVSVFELHDGTITRWWDYWDLGTLMNAAPQWWLDHIMQGYK